MGRLADALGFHVMFLVVASLPLLGLGGLRWLRGWEGLDADAEPARGARAAADQPPK